MQDETVGDGRTVEDEIEAGLSPCPRCGGKATIEGSDEIMCNSCGFWTGDEHDDLDEAIEWWNNQPHLDALRATIATQAAQLAQQDSDWLAMMKAIVAVTDNEWSEADDATLLEQFDPWQALREIGGTIATQAAELDRLRAELAEATGQLLSWHYDSKGEWGYPLSEEVWANNPLRQRYKDLTGVDWLEPVETAMEDDDDDD